VYDANEKGVESEIVKIKVKIRIIKKSKLQMNKGIKRIQRKKYSSVSNPITALPTTNNSDCPFQFFPPPILFAPFGIANNILFENTFEAGLSSALIVREFLVGGCASDGCRSPSGNGPNRRRFSMPDGATGADSSHLEPS
jgi:hypothetical protein